MNLFLLPSIGRFTSQDPAPGSLPNLYTYPLDPINESDLSGESLFGSIVSAVKKVAKAVAKVVSHVAAAVATTVVSVVKYAQTTARAIVPAIITIVFPPLPSIAEAPPTSSCQPDIEPVSQQIGETFDPEVIMVQSETNSSTLQPGPGTSNDFNLVEAMSADHDWSEAGEAGGAAVGCIANGVAAAFIDKDPAAYSEGCEEGKEWGAAPTKAVMGGIGYLLGGFDLPGAGIFDH